MDRLTSVLVVVLVSLCFFPSNDVEAKEQFVINHHGDLYDCVDFYKQPAFDHPLLANHTFHHKMRPSWMPETTRLERKLQVNNTEVQFKRIGCPVGTVPIRRITEEDHIRERMLYGLAKDTGPRHAIVRTKWNPRKKFNGGGATISIWNPIVQPSQYSSGQLVLRNGVDNIQVGWTTNWNLYGDSRTRLFIYTGAGDKAQCFNTRCPGFVLTDSSFALDGLVSVSKRGGPIYDLQLAIFKEPKDGLWWLRVGDGYTIGFWPKNIFTGLADSATSVIWGGQVYSPPELPSPPMGSGVYPKKDPAIAAYCKFIKVVNEDYELFDANPKEIETYHNSDYYGVNLRGNDGGSWGMHALFGGPGGNHRN